MAVVIELALFAAVQVDNVQVDAFCKQRIVLQRLLTVSATWWTNCEFHFSSAKK